MHESAGPRKTTDAQSIAATDGVGWRAAAAVIVGNVALAVGPWFVRLADVGPASAAFWRITLAVPVLIFAAWTVGGNPLRGTRGLGWLLIVAGVAFAADLASWHVGIVHTTLANATLFGNSTSLIYPIYGFLLIRTWPSRTQVVALVLAAAGAALLLMRSAELSPRNLAGDLFCLLAGLFYAGYFIAMARVRTRLSPLPALALSSTASVLPLLAIAVMLGERIVPGNWTPLIALAIVSQLLGQGLMIYALGLLPPIVMGIALLLQPVVSGTIGWIVYDERLGAPDFAGAALVALALVLVRRGPKTPVQLARARPRS